MKNITKTESVQEFLARGGKITKVAMNVSRRIVKSEEQREAIKATIDMSALPEHLRVKFGAK